MKTRYAEIAGQNLERLTALSDGIFAVAMTLLVLNLVVPEAKDLLSLNNGLPLWQDGALKNEILLGNKLLALLPHVLTYFMSFLTLGIFWVGQQTQLNHFKHSDRDLTWTHLTFLLGVSLLPFTTALLSTFITYRLALVIYWLNILWLGIALYFSLRHAKDGSLLRDGIDRDRYNLNRQRIFVAQALYLAATLFCVFNTYISIILIIAIQLCYAISPRIPRIGRI